MADHIYAGEWPVYFQEAWGHEPLYHYLHAAGMSLLGETVLGVRVTSILLGVLGVFTAYLVFRQLFGPSVAAVAAILLSASLWSLMYSRIGLRHVSLPPLIGLAAYCFWRGLLTDSAKVGQVTLWLGLGGLCAGAMLYTYFASRAVPALFVAFTLYLLVFHRRMLAGRWLGIILFFCLPLLIFAPLAFYLREHPELEQRLGQVGGELFAALWAGDIRPLLNAVVDTLKMFSLRGDPEWLYNISGRAVFGPASSLFFWGGVLLSLWRWRDPKWAFILLWLAIGIAPAMLSWPAGSLGHTIAAQPVTFVFPALAVVTTWQWATAREPSWLTWGVGTVIVLIVCSFVFVNGYDYFVRWPRFPEVRREYQAPITAVARYVEEHADSVPVCVSAPYVDYWNPWSKMSFALYTRRSDTRVCWFNGDSAILFPSEGESLFFVPDHLLLHSELDADLSPLLMAGSWPVEIGYQDWNGSTFDLYRWQDRGALEQLLRQVSSALLWASSEGPYVAGESERQRQALSAPLDMGHCLAFLGYDYDRTRVGRGEAVRVTTFWRVLDARDDALAVFVHVLDDSNAVQAGWDGLYVSPESWERGDVFLQVHSLTLPADMPSGAQRVELGVYSPVTLERLKIFAGGGTVPHDRVLIEPLNVR